jgi:hypothetical protein
LENREIEKILSKFDPIIKKLGDEPDKKTFESHKKNLKKY